MSLSISGDTKLGQERADAPAGENGHTGSERTSEPLASPEPTRAYSLDDAAVWASNVRPLDLTATLVQANFSGSGAVRWNGQAVGSLADACHKGRIPMLAPP